MNITLLNGNPAGGSRFEEYLQDLKAELENGNELNEIVLRDQDLHHCIGCFGCWIKFPGECVHQDDGAAMLRSVINSDLTLLASPLIMGFPSSLLKTAMDRSIPLLHPYFTLVKGEVHHIARYDRYPLYGLVIHSQHEMDDVPLVREIFTRFTINFQSELGCCITTATGIKEAAHEINSL